MLVGDHLVVDRMTPAPPAKWMPLVHYRVPSRRRHLSSSSSLLPSLNLTPNGKPQYFFLVKCLIGVPGDHIHLHNGIVIINGVAQAPPATSIAGSI